MNMDIEARLKAASPLERNRAIRDARDAGWTIRRIALTVGISVGLVHKIIKEQP